MRTIAIFACAASLSIAAACASSGRARVPAGTDGGRDSGTATPRDSGPVAMVDGGTATNDGGGVGPGSDAGGGTDAGMTLVRDAGARDAGTGGCTSAAECTNGLACDGVERCEAGRCVSGAPFACDDGIACTTNACVEPGSCAYMPNDALCGAGQSCDPARGCVSGCPESPCRLVSPQCGCPTGQGCYVDGTGSRLCATAGTAAENASCTTVLGCRAGNLCINVSASGTANVCSRFCNTDADCAMGALCLIGVSDGAGGELPGVTLCTHVCDPARQTGCPSGTACDLFRETTGLMRNFTDCTAPVGTGTQGSLCTDPSDCRAGYACIDPDGTGGVSSQCMHWCEVATGVGCGSAETCFGFTTPLRVGSREYGVCD